MCARTLLLLGSGEFEPWSAGVERVALERASGDGSVLVLPTASAPEGDEVFERWARIGLEHFAGMGVAAEVVPVKRREDALGSEHAERVAAASMVFLSGGNPRFLSDTLRDTPLWSAVLAGLARGMVFAGCSAGAMVASRLPSRRPRLGAAWVSGLDLVPNVSFGAHWDRIRFIPGMQTFVIRRSRLDGWFAGIDERTAILGDGRRWTVYGRGVVTVRGTAGVRAYRAGESFATG